MLPGSFPPPRTRDAFGLFSAVPLAASGASVWPEAFAGLAVPWAALAATAVLAAALAIHLAYVLADRRGAPPKLTEALKYAVEAGNYQEAWEICGRGNAAFLARLLQPALERIGEGRAAVEGAIEQRFQREQKFLAALLRGFLLGGTALPLLYLIIGWVASGPSAGDELGATAAAGSFALFAAAIFAVVTACVVLGLGFRARALRSLPVFREEAEGFLRNLAYEDLEGLRIGLNFDAGSIQGADPRGAATGRLRVSRELTTACPNCNAPINPSRNPCPYCGSSFEWS